MATLSDRRYRLLWVLAALIAISVAALVTLLLPGVFSPSEKAEELRRLEQERQARTREVAPLSGIDRKLVTATQQLQEFYRDRLPSRASEIVQRIGELADEHEVELTSVRYGAEPAEVAGVQRLELDASLTGEYRQLVGLINALERDKMLFVIDSVALAGQRDGVVRLSLRVQAFRKG